MPFSISSTLPFTRARLLPITLNYQDGNSPQWNGNITDQYWGTFANRNKYYNYGYDKLGRLTYGASGQSKGESYQYDKNGNLTQLYREGRGVNEYNYVGNLLGSIGGSNTFRPGYMTWDWNGNLSYDSNEGRSYYYYSFDKPWYTTKGPDLVAWAYDPNGRKLERYSTLTGRSDFYQDGVHYLNGNLDYVQTGEGIARKSGGTYTYEYYIKDHLGNTRESIAKNPTSGNMEVVQKADYFPFGLEIPVTTPGNKDPYLYNGKELDEELTQYDYGARFYDPVIGRWTSVDPKAELGRRWSPYNYGFDNPIRFTDPDGMWPWDDLYKQAKSYVANAVKEAAYSAVKSTVNYVRNYVNETAASISKTLTIEPKAEVIVSAGAQAGGKIDKTAGAVRNAGSADLLKLKVGLEISPTGIRNTSEASFIGKDGDVNVRSSYGNNVTIPVGEVPLGLGMDMEHTATFNFSGGKATKTAQSFSETQGISVYGVNMSGGIEQDIKKNQSYIKGSIGVAGEAALGIGIRSSAGVDVKAEWPPKP